jgi:hypothetical protein
MSYTDHLRSGIAHRNELEIGGHRNRAPEQRDPTNVPPPSLTHPSQWIRRYTIRYTLKGAAFTNSNSILPTASAPPPSNQNRHTDKVLLNTENTHRLSKPPPRVRRTPPRPNERPDVHVRRPQLRSHDPSTLVVCRQHTYSSTNPTQQHPLSNLSLPMSAFPTFSNMATPQSNLPNTYKHAMMRDRPATL